MNRRQFVAGACATLLVPALPAAAAEVHVDYTPEAYAAAMESGKPLLLDFYASW